MRVSPRRLPLRLSHLLHGRYCVPTVAHFGLKAWRPGRRHILVCEDHEVRNADSLRHVSREAGLTLTEGKTEPKFYARMYFPFEENVDSLLLRRGQPRRGRVPPSAGSRKRLRGEKFPVRRTLRLHRAHTPLCECVRVEVRQRAIVRPAREGANSIITWECLCFLAHCRERERERKERVCVCVCVLAPRLLSFLLLISMQTPESLQCGRHGYAECLIHGPEFKERNLQWTRGWFREWEPGCEAEAYFIIEKCQNLKLWCVTKNDDRLKMTH